MVGLLQHQAVRLAGRLQPGTPAAVAEAFDGELAIQAGDDDLTVARGQRTVDHR